MLPRHPCYRRYTPFSSTILRPQSNKTPLFGHFSRFFCICICFNARVYFRIRAALWNLVFQSETRPSRPPLRNFNKKSRAKRAATFCNQRLRPPSAGGIPIICLGHNGRFYFVLLSKNRLSSGKYLRYNSFVCSFICHGKGNSSSGSLMYLEFAIWRFLRGIKTEYVPGKHNTGFNLL